MSIIRFFRWLFGRKKKEAVSQPVPAAAPQIDEEKVAEALPAPAKAEALPAPEMPEALPAPVVPEALPAPVKAEALPAPEKKEALPAPEKAEDLPAPSEPVTVTLTAPKSGMFFRPMYNFSFTARLIQADDTVKGYYSEIKNELLRYGVKSRISWRYETFRKGRKLLVKLVVRGKSLYVYLALDPASYADTKYKIKDVSDVKSKANVPVLYKIKNLRRLKYVKELIADVMAANGIASGELPAVDYAAGYPYESVEQLIEEKLVKIIVWKEVDPEEQELDEEDDEEEFEDDDLDDTDDEEEDEEEEDEIAAAAEPEPAEEEIFEEPVKAVAPEEVKESVTVVEAEEVIADEEVVHYVEEGAHYSDKTRKGIVNVDTLSKYFKKGETATVAEMVKRIPAIGKKVTYVKVLARGTLDKALIVEADDFSPAAIKMIVLTGGKVIRTKQRT